MDQDVRQSIENIELQLIEVDRRIAHNEDQHTALEIAHKALALKLDEMDAWIERVNLAFVKELAK